MNGVPYQRQIAALNDGTTYFKEFMRPWPYCGVYVASVQLDGFSEAYAIFDRESRARGW